MTTVKYNNKQYKLPFEVELPEDPTATDTVRNRFGGQSCTLPAFAIAVYDVIIGSEMLGDYQTVRDGLDWFSKHFTKEYMVLLDQSHCPGANAPGLPINRGTNPNPKLEQIKNPYPPFYKKGSHYFRLYCLIQKVNGGKFVLNT